MTMLSTKLHFQNCPKAVITDLDKARLPEETLKIFYDRIGALDLKILNEVKRIDTGRLDIPVYFSVCGDDAREIMEGAKKAMGKGSSPVQAEASACMELTERFSFFSFKNNLDNFLLGDYKNMEAQGYPVLPINYLLQSVGDTSTSADVAYKLLDGIPLKWVWGTNVSRDEKVLIPFSWFYAINEYNGSSAGNTVEEAALQGICEVVERHVCAKICLDKISVPIIDPETVKDPVAQDLLAKFAREKIAVTLFDFTLDTGIPTVAAIAIDPSTFPEKSEIVFTAGTAPSPEKALIRTLTEIAQLGGDFQTGSNYLASGLPKPRSLEEISYLTDSPLKASMEQIPDLSRPNMKTEIENCLSCLKGIGMEVFIVDVTFDRLQIPALYTIVPGADFRERSRSHDIGLFIARVLVDMVEDIESLEKKLDQMEEYLPGAYYLEFYRGRNFYNMGLAKFAYSYLNKALQNNPAEEDIPYIRSYLGLCLKDMERYSEAIMVLQEGLKYDEERADIYNTIGVCYFKLKEYEKAISQFKRAVELDPSSAMDYANIGVNYSRLGENSQAKEFLTLALTLDPSLDFARALLDEMG